MSTYSRWVEHVLNPKTITSIYSKEPPSLAQVKLYEVSIVCGGDLQCKLRFDLKDFPANAPVKWIQRQCNAVQMSLNLMQTELIQCAIPSGNSIGDLSIMHDGARFQVTFSTQSQGIVFQAIATWIHVDNLAGYQKELR
ncbi:Imm50 family immunity protein [Hymenobacter rigui]|uniref:Uncharacterized protein n=1 Tax=Hymenobacter rigui TaxID=334424 RepID=A0A428KEP9_9BACT|nr:hypothetical protein EI291_19775 [Hymenobacter rigui]